VLSDRESGTARVDGVGERDVPDRDSGRCVMQERQSAVDHPRSDDVKGRERHDGEDDRGIGDRGDFGDQGIDQSAAHADARNQGAAATGSGPDTTRPDSGSPAD